MPSFDIVSEVDFQEIDNSVNQAAKEIESRFDFKGSKSSIDFDKVAKVIKVLADDDMKLRAMHQILAAKMAKRGIDLRSLDYGKEELGSMNSIKQTITLKNGLDKEAAKKVTKIIKESGLKVQAQIQDDQVRVTGKKIDDLQEVIALLKTSSELGIPLQYINMRS
jgi:uncharacterized protein YajQ (UPF0234 family)